MTDLLGAARLWWHCLLRCHRGSTIWFADGSPTIRYCADCHFGRRV